MKNFEIEYNGKKYWHSRSVAMLAMIVGIDGNGNKFILANKRGKNTPDYQHCWCMPCGYLDFDETTEQAIKREVFEETGAVIPEDYFILHSIDSIPTERQNVTIRYMVKSVGISEYALTSKNSEIGEVDEVKWIYLRDINAYEWAFNHNDLIKKYVLT